MVVYLYFSAHLYNQVLGIVVCENLGLEKWDEKLIYSGENRFSRQGENACIH